MLCDNLEGWDGGGTFKKKGIYLYLWLIHVDIWQKSMQYYKAIILQLKINEFKKDSSQIGLEPVVMTFSVF